jgi:hypothetical protein
MSTHARVGLQQDDGLIRSIYVHCDGYLEGVGSTRDTGYRERAAIEALLSEGDASGLGHTLADSFFYARDRGEPRDEVASRVHPSYQWPDDAFYQYLWAEGRWYTRSGPRESWVPLADALKLSR